MATQSAIHHLLAILAGDLAPSPGGDAAVDSLTRLIGRLGWGGLAPVAPDASRAGDPAPCFLRVTFPGIAPPDSFIVSVAAAAGLRVEWLAHGPSFALESIERRATGGRPHRWLFIGPQTPADVSSAVARLRAVHRIHAVPFTTIED